MFVDLTVDKQGDVIAAVVVDGPEPFAEQARTTLLTWRFTPARRGDAPIVARTHARVEFRQEALMPTSPPVAPARSTPPGVPLPAQPEPPEEVVVRGKRHEIGETTLSAEDIREMPGAFGDPFRAIEALPGVIPLVSGLPFFYIRGAPPTNNAYLVDGIRVPLLFHVGIGEGVIHPSLIDHLDFFPGAAPSSYGNVAGAVVAGMTRDPATAVHGEANLRLIDSGALVEAPFADGRGTALVAGRYGYPGLVVSAITPSIQLGYWDYQARFSWKLDPRDAISVFAFGSHDYLGAASTMNGRTGPVVEELGSDFHRVDLRYDRSLDSGHLRVAATLGYDAMGGAALGDDAPVSNMTNLSFATRLEVDSRITKSVRVRGGIDTELDEYGTSSGQGGSNSASVVSAASPPPNNFRSGGHADLVWNIAPRVEIVPGLRFDLYESIRDDGPSGAPARQLLPALDPRLATRITITPSIASITSVGLTHQYPVLRLGAVPALLVAVPGFPAGDTELQTAAQLSQGLEWKLPWDFTLTTTGFLSDWSGLTDVSSACLQIMPAVTTAQPNSTPPTPPYTCPSDAPAHGVAYGLEVLLRRSLSKRLAGWLSYTLSRSQRDESFVTASGGSAQATVPSDYDRTHILNAIVTYDLGRHWRAGARFIVMSGTPYSTLSGNTPVPPYNAYRSPPFYRVDLRLEKRWLVGRHGSVAFVAEVANVTLSKQVTPLGSSCEGMESQNGATMTTQCTQNSTGPITIPSIGVEGSYDAR